MGNVFAEFLQNSGLYDEITITQENVQELISLIAGEVRLDVYCKECGGEMTRYKFSKNKGVCDNCIISNIGKSI